MVNCCQIESVSITMCAIRSSWSERNSLGCGWNILSSGGLGSVVRVRDWQKEEGENILACSTHPY